MIGTYYLKVPFSMKCSIHVFANDRFIHTSRSPLAWFFLACLCVSAICICEDLSDLSPSLHSE